MLKFYPTASLHAALPDLTKLNHQAEFLRSIPEDIMAGNRPFVSGSEHVKIRPDISDASPSGAAAPVIGAPPDPVTLRLRVQKFAATLGLIPGNLLDFFSRKNQRVSYVYTDNCCHDRSILNTAFFPETGDPVVRLAPLKQLEDFGSVPVLYGKRTRETYPRCF